MTFHGFRHGELAEPVEYSIVKNMRDTPDEKAGPALTVVSVIDAGGEKLPGIIVYPLTDSIPQSIIKGHTRDFSIGKSDTGKMSPKIFEGYILNILIPNLKTKNK